MSDNKNNRGPQDRTKINVNEEYELRYWSEKFKVTPDQLKKAVNDAVISAQAVEEALKKTSRR